MKQLNAKFIVSAEKLSQCPDFNLNEFPLLGRSNVGKSSFINSLANNKKLAKTSNTPGKTRLINFFNFSDMFIIADLPGYGYAKISLEAQKNWQKYLEEYLLNRQQINSLIQFIDARHEIQKNDYQMREWVLAHQLPVFTVVTKIDYTPKNKTESVLNNVKKEFGGVVLPFSAIDRKYCEQILSYINELCIKK
ncbi:MAG: ribosome biogenesis GTP-binding protein YihA/YsxC [Candidatus Gastranaerophilales bacterium]|nr:ribosome biogenesis GTP-binding protein YihA/YsxC [Candidatus Gastranaerophilales bacterium]